MSSPPRGVAGRALLVALLVVLLIVLLAGFCLPPLGDEVALPLAVISLLLAVALMGVVIYRGVATGMRRPQSILREVRPESRNAVRKAWRSDAGHVPPDLFGVLGRYAAAQVIACENSALTACTFAIIWANGGADSTVDAVLRGLAVCFVVLGLVSIGMAGRWRRLRSSVAAAA